MPFPFATPIGRVSLDLGAAPGGETPYPAFSAVVQGGNGLWVASDETASVERLVTRDFQRYGRAERFPLDRFFDLPAGPGGEVDIESLDIADGRLWVCGSHSLKRKKPRPDEGPGGIAERLVRVTREPNRYLLGCIPIADGEAPELVPGTEDGRQAGCLALSAKGSALTDALAEDEHIHRFLAVPAKENGFDVEGMAVRGNRVFLGLRGPVLRGWAIVLELEIRAGKPGRLKLCKFGDGRRYRKHFLDLDGLGIRDLTLDGDDLLILAGPTMDLDGPIVLYRWPGALETAANEPLVRRNRLDRLLFVPFGAGHDHAEGTCLFRRPGAGPAILVAYDNPGQHRLHRHGRGVDADLFALPR